MAETHKTEGIQVNTSALQSLLGNSLNAKLELITEHHQAQNLNRFLTDSPKTRTANLTSAKGILTEKELQDLSPYMVDILNVDAGKRNHFLKIISRHRIQNENAKPGEYAFTNPFLTNTCLLFSEGIPVDDFLCLDEKDQVGFATQAKQVIALLKNGMGAETLMQTGAEGLIKIRENLGSEIWVLYNGNKEAKAIVINNAISLLSELTKQSGACPTPF